MSAEYWLVVGIQSLDGTPKNVRSGPSLSAKVIRQLTSVLYCEINVYFVSPTQPAWFQFREEAGTDCFYARSDVIQFVPMPPPLDLTARVLRLEEIVQQMQSQHQ